MALNEGLSPITGIYKTTSDMLSRRISNDRIIGLTDGRRYRTQATNTGQGLLLASGNYAIPIRELIKIATAQQLTISADYAITIDSAITLPAVSGIPLLSKVKITALSGTTSSTINVDGGGGELIDDGGTTSSSFVINTVGTEYVFIFNGTNWEVYSAGASTLDTSLINTWTNQNTFNYRYTAFNGRFDGTVKSWSAVVGSSGGAGVAIYGVNATGATNEAADAAISIGQSTLTYTPDKGVTNHVIYHAGNLTPVQATSNTVWTGSNKFEFGYVVAKSSFDGTPRAWGAVVGASGTANTAIFGMSTTAATSSAAQAAIIISQSALKYTPDTGVTSYDIYTSQNGVPATRTISAGTYMTGGGDLSANRTINHADTSTQSSVNNSGATVIQDVTLDGAGHVTSLGSATLTYSTVGAGGLSANNTWSGTNQLTQGYHSSRGNAGGGSQSWAANLGASGTSNTAIVGVKNSGSVFGCDSFIEINSTNIRYYNGSTYYTIHHAGNDPCDERLKSNFSIIDDATSKIGRIKSGTFERLDLGGKIKAGVSAQDLQRELPCAVDSDSYVTSDNKGSEEAYLTPNAMAIIALLMQSNKEMNERISSLEASVHQLLLHQH